MINEDKTLNIEVTLQGARNSIGVSKNVIRALGRPSYISIKISKNYDSFCIFPCNKNDSLPFNVPARLFMDHHCVMRITSKRFVHSIMKINNLDTSKTYVLSGEYLPTKNAVVFSLIDGVKQREGRKAARFSGCPDFAT